MTPFHDAQVVELFQVSTVLATKSENCTTAAQDLHILFKKSVVADVS